MSRRGFVYSHSFDAVFLARRERVEAARRSRQALDDDILTAADRHQRGVVLSRGVGVQVAPSARPAASTRRSAPP